MKFDQANKRGASAEKMRTVSFVDSDASKFKGFDRQTPQAAKKLGEVPRKQDRNAAIATLQGSCLACHQSFAKPFKEHFYGQQ